MPGTYDNPDIVFVHLSDIHFRKDRTGDAHDEDTMLRNELERDLRRLRAKLPRIDGILVSGDIAFGGKPDEYAYAEAWLKAVCESLGCLEDCVLVTPGNHDVDRSSVFPDSEIDLLHRAVRQAASQAARDEALAQILRHPDRGPLLLSPMAAYNNFARRYGCSITPMQPFWERDFPFSDGTTLRVWGLTTTLLSGPSDHPDTHRMMYGSAQRSILRTDNIHNMVMGHHPPSWSIEGDVAVQIYSTLTILQTFGHVHEQWITRTGNSVRVIAGAVQPSRHEAGWLPRYSAIALSILDERHIGVRVYLRRWSIESLDFIPDFDAQARDYRDYPIDVDPPIQIRR